jgi:hypothetical protein
MKISIVRKAYLLIPFALLLAIVWFSGALRRQDPPRASAEMPKHFAICKDEDGRPYSQGFVRKAKSGVIVHCDDGKWVAGTR